MLRETSEDTKKKKEHAQELKVKPPEQMPKISYFAERNAMVWKAAQLGNSTRPPSNAYSKKVMVSKAQALVTEIAISKKKYLPNEEQKLQLHQQKKPKCAVKEKWQSKVIQQMAQPTLVIKHINLLLTIAKVHMTESWVSLQLKEKLSSVKK